MAGPTTQAPDATSSRPTYKPQQQPVPTAAQPQRPTQTMRAELAAIVSAPQPAPEPTVAPATISLPYVVHPAGAQADQRPAPDHDGSTYIPMDSWVYQAMTRLYSLGYLDTMFLGMRPWTRLSALHMLEQSQEEIMQSNDEQAQEILAKMMAYLSAEDPDGRGSRGLVYGLDSSYTRLMEIGGPILRDSYHIGQTISNDYGRPYQTGFNSISGTSTVEEWGRFSLYVRGEYQHAPWATGYSSTLSRLLPSIDYIAYVAPNVPEDTVPQGPIAVQNPFRLVEATLSFHLWGNEISGGKSDAWLGPAAGASMAWSNNAENIYSFRINRVEPLNIYLLSKILGPMRYDFFYGSLKGHTAPNSPYVHSEMFSFRPTDNFEFGFQRTIIFGGEGHEPVTLHTFINGFFDPNDTTYDEKFSRNDPGARFSDFNFSYRVPFARKFATLYLDSICHDDVTPISAPRRAAYRTGLYFPQIPKLNRLDLRIEGVTTDPGVTPSRGGTDNYYEVVQAQGYTNKGFIMGDWIGREAKGGQAWLTYHLSGNEWVQLEYLNKKIPKDFIPGGTTQNQFKLNVVKRLAKEVELNAWVQFEGWKAPVPVDGVNLFRTGLQRNTVAAFQLTWFPKLHNCGDGSGAPNTH